jgi:probable rRNA maturation factor
MKLSINQSGKIPAKIFKDLLKKIPKIPEENLELLLTNNAEIHAINLKYRNIDRPTDVLSFAERESPNPDPKFLGQIIISLDRAAEQAEELHQSLEEELRFLFVHGLLHILGYDHEDPEDEKVMLKEAYRILGR